MGSANLDIEYDVIDEVINNLQTEIENTDIATANARINVNNIDLNDIFADSTGDSVEDLKEAFIKVKSAYKLINSLLEASKNMLVGIKKEYLTTDTDMQSDISCK